MLVVLDGSVYFSDFIESEASVEDGFEVKRVELDCAVVIFYCLFEVLLLAGLPSIGVQDIGLFQGVLSGDILLREASIIEGTILIGPDRSSSLFVYTRAGVMMLQQDFSLPLREVTSIDFQRLQLILIRLHKIVLTNLLLSHNSPPSLIPPSLQFPLLLVQPQRIVIIIQCFFVLSNPVEAGSSRQQCIDMRGIEFYDNREVFYCCLYLLQFLICAAYDVVGPYIPLVDVQQAVAVLNRLLEQPFLHV